MEHAELERALEALGAVLERRGLRFELVAVGGSALMLLGFISRSTKDLDVVAVVDRGRYLPADPLPPELEQAQADVGRAMGLGEDWLNPGPADVLRLGLPEGFADRVEVRRFGGLVLHLAGRLDQICLKLYAAADQGPGSKHLQDLQRLAPTPEELLFAARWTRTHDPSEGFRELLLRTLAALGVEVGDADL